jgi:hypothetical protein
VKYNPASRSASHTQADFVVKLQNKFGDPSLCREWNNKRAVEAKMVVPDLQARIEEPHDFACLGIERSEVAAFRPVAFQTSEAKIIEHGLPAMFFGDDVVDLMGVEAVAVVDQTIFAASFGTVNDLLSQRIGDVGHWR